MKKPTEDTLLIAFDAKHDEDQAAMVVGRHNNEKGIHIVNTFQGDEAMELYNKLIAKKGE